MSIDCSLIYPYLEDANWKNELRSKDNLALGYLTSCLRQEGFSVSMIHAEHNKHSVNDIIECFQLARELGFDNINMDIIVGLPQETKEDVENTLEEIKKLGPDNLTVHSLAIKRAARLNTQKEEYAGMKSVNSESTMELTQDAAEEMGMKPYYLYRQKNMTGNMENVGYAKPGKEGIYNILIMEEMQTIVALGAGAITKAVYPNGRIERCENVKDIKTYLEKTDEMIERKKRLFADEKRSD